MLMTILLAILLIFAFIGANALIGSVRNRTSTLTDKLTDITPPRPMTAHVVPSKDPAFNMEDHLRSLDIYVTNETWDNTSEELVFNPILSEMLETLNKHRPLEHVLPSRGWRVYVAESATPELEKALKDRGYNRYVRLPAEISGRPRYIGYAHTR